MIVAPRVNSNTDVFVLPLEELLKHKRFNQLSAHYHSRTGLPFVRFTEKIEQWEVKLPPVLSAITLIATDRSDDIDKFTSPYISIGDIIAHDFEIPEFAPTIKTLDLIQINLRDPHSIQPKLIHEQVLKLLKTEAEHVSDVVFKIPVHILDAYGVNFCVFVYKGYFYVKTYYRAFYNHAQHFIDILCLLTIVNINLRPFFDDFKGANELGLQVSPKFENYTYPISRVINEVKHTGQIDSITSDINTKQTNIKDYQDSITRIFEQIQILNSKLFFLQHQASTDASNAALLRMLQNHNVVRDVRIHRGQLIIYTNLLTINQVYNDDKIHDYLKKIRDEVSRDIAINALTDMDKYRLVVGAYRISINFQTLNYSFEALPSREWNRQNIYNTSGATHRLAHGHQMHNCLGSFQNKVSTAKGQQDITALFQVLMQYLQTINITDPAGYHTLINFGAILNTETNKIVRNLNYNEGIASIKYEGI